MSEYILDAAAVMRSDDGKGGSSRDDNKKPPISDDTYNRIPDKFKRPGSRSDESQRRGGGGGGNRPPQNNNNNNNNNGSGSSTEGPRRPSIAVVLFLLGVAGILMFGYRSFFSPKSSEITWTAFNRLLDAGDVESATLKGGTLSGSLRRNPELTEWVDLIPDGMKLFSTAVAQYDRAHPNSAKSLDEELDALCNEIELCVARPRVASPDAMLTVSIVRKQEEKREDAPALLSESIPSTASEDEVAALKR